MKTMTLQSCTGRDGRLDLHVQTDMPEEPVEVVLVVQSLALRKSQTKRGWPENFIERTAGCLSQDPIRRPAQGDFEQREALQ